jgi:murein DD-endopeptidase MepM/ murein hydrolase activator NlpD
MKIGDFKLRQPDKFGSGFFGASRGDRSHNGIDLEAIIGTQIESPLKGVVTKLGWPYAQPERSHIRYVEVTDPSKEYRFRFFYTQPVVEVGDEIEIGDVLGVSQLLSTMYPGITEHIHFEIKNSKDEYIDPTPVYLVLSSL